MSIMSGYTVEEPVTTSGLKGGVAPVDVCAPAKGGVSATNAKAAEQSVVLTRRIIVSCSALCAALVVIGRPVASICWIGSKSQSSESLISGNRLDGLQLHKRAFEDAGGY
jgi:hypothetical protein